MRVRIGSAVLACATMLVALPASTRAQEWRAAAQLGRVSYDGAPAGATATSSVVVGLSRSGFSDWLGVSASLPLGDDPFWGVAAAWKRFEFGTRAGGLLEFSGHGFFQRHSVTDTTQGGGLPFNPLQRPGTVQSEISGAGVGGEALAGGFASLGPAHLELRGGAVLQRSVLGEVDQQRVLPTGDARVSLARLPLVAGVEGRGWWAQEAEHAYAGATLQLLHGPMQLWASAGQWLHGGVDGVVWSGGASVQLNDRVTFQLGARGNGFDPLYEATTSTSFSFGGSVRVGGRPLGVRAPVPARYEDGRAVIRIPLSSAANAPSIAGDFTDWQPRRMERDGRYWTYATALEPGVYHYAFVTEDGTWFVPESVPGRKDDGMGGHVAVLVVAS